MSYSAQVFRILIASPSDVTEEREIAVKTIQEWNDLNSAERQLVLLPLRWETHSAPEYGKRPQEVINRQVVDQCDLLVGAFWTRIGSPTGVSDSGTLEEIERVAKDGKPVMLYFSKADKNPDDIDLEQLKKLREFKKKTFPNALVENYSGPVEFRDKLARQLEIQLRALLVDAGDVALESSKSPYTDIIFQFADPDSGEGIGNMQEISATLLKITDYEDIPDYSPKRTTPRSKEREELLEVIMSSRHRDRDYYRDSINRIIAKSKNRPIRFWLKNTGTVGARDVFIDIKLRSDGESISLQTARHFETEGGVIYFGDNETVEAAKLSDTAWSTSLEMRALQPKREVSPARKLLLGGDGDCQISVEASIYADTLSEPIIRKLTIDYKVKVVETSYKSLLEELEERE
ncbi:MAG: hypothetical protein JNN07_24505 [Verrucomicrobiales bacterium]|jgi:hypothetical protein|nr:hypothetical protein [Verrucomicrobiales bacterium]